jgi:PBP1b-binding outer membrane lipoprotein LpoB
MKWISLLLFVCLLFSACSHNAVSDVVTEQVPIDYGKVIELAQKEFNAIFDEFTNLKIQETKTVTRAGNDKHFIIEITYSSDNGNGVYGLEYLKDDYGSYELLKRKGFN